MLKSPYICLSFQHRLADTQPTQNLGDSFKPPKVPTQSVPLVPYRHVPFRFYNDICDLRRTHNDIL